MRIQMIATGLFRLKVNSERSSSLKLIESIIQKSTMMLLNTLKRTVDMSADIKQPIFQLSSRA
jgi:hypothetical protein